MIVVFVIQSDLTCMNGTSAEFELFIVSVIKVKSEHLPFDFREDTP